MDKQHLPKAFGVFKPVGHTVIAYCSDDALSDASQALDSEGFQGADVVRYTADEMRQQAQADMRSASGLATIGQELNLVKAHLALAEAGCSFLVVHASDDDKAERVANIARRTKAVAAQRYGRFIIEELIASPRGERQVFESPDRGLDIRVPDSCEVPGTSEASGQAGSAKPRSSS